MFLKIAISRLAYQDKLLFTDVELEVSKGDKILIVGATGSGKTSLLHTLNLMNPHYEGSILFEGVDIKTYKPEALRYRIMEVMQEPWLDDVTVLEALKEPWQYLVNHKRINSIFNTPEWDTKLQNLLTSFGLESQLLDSKCSKLSGGEKQRVALIRSLQFDPEVLLLDEISSALDQKTSSIISQCLFNHYNGTIIAISHDHLWQNSWQKLWEVSDGRIIVKDLDQSRGAL